MKYALAGIWRTLSTKLGSDIAWNLGSFALLAVCGVLVNLIIAFRQGTEALGVFNQVYAIYIGVSQIFVFGVHYSVLKHTAQHAKERALRDRILASAVAVGLAQGVLACGAVLLFRAAAGRVLESDAVAESLFWTAPALLLFPLNKILLAAANGLREMKFFAVAQAARYLCIVVWIAAVAWVGADARLNAAAFVCGEAVVTVLALGYLLFGGHASPAAATLEWIRIHLAFGSKSLLAGLFVELNSRVDTLMVGLFMSDSAVGVYSFATMFVDGFIQMLVVVRNNFNPLLVRHVHERDYDGLRGLVRRTRRLIYPLALGVLLTILAAFAAIVHTVMADRGLEQGMVVLAILLSAAWLCSAFVPFDNILMQGGYPGMQAIQQTSIIAMNIALNALLIPPFGLPGAAFATGAAYLCGVAVLIGLVRQCLGFNLLTASPVPGRWTR